MESEFEVFRIEITTALYEWKSSILLIISKFRTILLEVQAIKGRKNSTHCISLQSKENNYWLYAALI